MTMLLLHVSSRAHIVDSIDIKTGFTRQSFLNSVVNALQLNSYIYTDKLIYDNVKQAVDQSLIVDIFYTLKLDFVWECPHTWSLVKIQYS